MYPIYTYEDYREKLNDIFMRYSNKVAITCIGDNDIDRSITYKELHEIVISIIECLSKLGIQRAQRVAVITPPTAEAVVLNLALAYGGYTNVLIDATLSAVECDKLIKYADVDAVFSTETIYSQIESELKSKVPVIEINGSFKYKLFDEYVTECKKCNVEPYDEEVIAIIFSSGTTAEMKGVMVTYNSVLYAQKCICKYANLNSEVKFFDVLPSNHIAGYSSSMSCLLTGSEVGFVTEINADKLLSGFACYNPTHFIMIPKVYEVIKNKLEVAISKKTFLIRQYARIAMKLCGSVREKTGINLRLLTKPIWKAVFGSKMKLCGCGTLPCSEEIIRFYLNLGMEFLNVYGATETGFPITAADCNEKYPLKGAGNIGQFEEIKITIFEPDEDGVGEIRVKTPLIMKGYFREPDLTRQAFDENGYFKTGDLGYIDEGGYLYITGRIKEAIVLQNGKKVSPIDVDKYYQKDVRNIVLASCGVSMPEGYDNIYLFVEKANHTEEEVNNALATLRALSQNTSLYRFEEVLGIDKIPTTAVGKVKRFMLKKYVEDVQLSDGKIDTANKEENGFEDNREEIVIRLISKYAQGEVVTLESNLKTELGIDSLSMFELSIEIENELGIDVANRWDRIETVQDILSNNENCNADEKDYATHNFPLQRKKGDLAYIRLFGRVTSFLYGVEIDGVENIPKDENVLFCPNHESYFDAMWVASTLEKEGFETSRFCCLAAEHLKDKAFIKKAFRALGGIPVDRSGNTAPAMKRAAELLRQNATYMLIHPEGTRTRNGNLGEFKHGASQLAKETGVKIVPVCIDGAYEIYPACARVPRLFDWRKLRRYRLKITFGEAIMTDKITKEEITEKIKRFILEQKNGEIG